MDINLTATSQGDCCRLALSGELAIYDAAELKQQLLGYLHQSQHLQINLAEVDSLDCAGFQLLYLLKREAQVAGKKLSLIAHSAATLEVLELLNMEAFFGAPVILAC